MMTHVCMIFGPGVPKLEACWEDEITLVWDGTHDLAETAAAACDSEVTQQWLGEQNAGHEQTFTNLGGQFRGQTRYFKSTAHCAPDAGRFEVFCPLIVDPDRTITVNTAASDLEVPAVIVGISIAIVLCLLMACILCPRAKRRKKKYTPLSTIPEVDEEDEQEEDEAELGQPKLIY